MISPAVVFRASLESATARASDVAVGDHAHGLLRLSRMGPPQSLSHMTRAMFGSKVSAVAVATVAVMTSVALMVLLVWAAGQAKRGVMATSMPPETAFAGPGTHVSGATRGVDLL
jgi:hypothetical protein